MKIIYSECKGKQIKMDLFLVPGALNMVNTPHNPQVPEICNSQRPKVTPQ